MKKILTSLLVLSMLVCCMSISAFAANRAVFTVDNASGKAGEEIKINVNITDNQGIAAGKVTLTCDQLTITKITQGKWAVDEEGDKVGTGTPNASEGIYNWYYTDEVDSEGVYCTYTATIKADAAPGEYEIKIVAEDLAGVKHNEDGEDEVVSYKDGEWDATQTDTATLTIEGEPTPPPPVKEELEITANPQNVTVTEDEAASFSVTAKGEGLTYQWQKKVDGEWTDIDGATAATYAIAKTALTDAGEYRVVVTDKDGEKAESAAATLTVNKKQEEQPPVTKELKITADPKDAKVTEGDKATFTVTAEGEDIAYQWQKKVDGEFKNIDGATAASYEIAKTTMDDNGAQFRVIVTDKDGKTVTSATAKLTVEKKAEEQPPVTKELKITAEPKDAKVTEGDKATFTVTVEGEGVTYQWQKKVNGQFKDIAGATGASYEIAKTALSDNGAEFRVIVTDKDGKTVTSATAKLTVEKKADTGTTTGGDKDKDKDKTAKTGDSTNLYIYMALCMFAAAVIVGVTYELKKNRE